MKHTVKFYTVLIPAVFIIFSILTFNSCRTPEEPVETVVLPPTPEMEPEAVKVVEPDPLNIAWAGTAWVLPDSPDKSPKEFPGYRGFFLGRDGQLLLINQDEAAGNRWEAEGNRLTLFLLEGTPELSMEGTFLVFPEPPASIGTDNDKISGIRLVPESNIGAEGITFNRVKVNVDIIENHWIPKQLKEGEKVVWPMNREIHLMLLPDTNGMGVLGYGGENRFHGSIQLGEESFLVGPLAITRRTGPASEFESLYVKQISEANRFVQAGDDLYLYADTYPLAAFRVRLFD